MEYNTDNRFLKTGTTTLGIVCRDGIVLAADKKITMGPIVSDLGFEKVVIINENLAVTIAGGVSDVQLLLKIIRGQIKVEELRRGKQLTIKESANLLSNLVYQNVRKMSSVQGITGFLIGGKDNNGYHLFILGPDGSLVLKDKYVCDGSGMEFAMGVLEAQFKLNMTIEEVKNLAISAINASIQRDTASGGGIDIVTITKDGTKKVHTEKIEGRLKQI